MGQANRFKGDLKIMKEKLFYLPNAYGILEKELKKEMEHSFYQGWINEEEEVKTIKKFNIELPKFLSDTEKSESLGDGWFRITISFTGTSLVFEHHPSTHTSMPPYGCVCGGCINTISWDYSMNDYVDAKSVRRDWDNNIVVINEWLNNFAKKDVENFNKRMINNVKNSFNKQRVFIEREKQFLKDL